MRVIESGVETSLDGLPRDNVMDDKAEKRSSVTHCMKGDKGERGDHGQDGAPGPPGENGESGGQSQVDAVLKALEAKVDALFSSYTAEIARLRNEVHDLKSKFVRTLGSEANPAKSCKQIYEQERFSPSGAYYLNVTGVPGGVTRTYCYMEENIGCPAGSTLVMKIDGTKATFQYSSPLWSNKETYNQDGGSTFYDSKETKLATYWSTPVSKVCVGMRTDDSWNMESLIIKRTSTSLYDFLADGNYRPTKGGREVWKSILPGSTLRKGCLREGFNVHGQKPDSAGSRIGVIADDKADCSSPDSFIGFGTGGGTCGSERVTSCGNEPGCKTNGNKSIPAFGYIFVY